ncbi:ABC transporter ATP-binding protein [candidate division KSB1 bacterium]|nr:ABC transporter ATP-binding protein [candidate division KSB1 bacterium]
MKVLEVSNLTKYYGKILGVKDVSFSVEEGEIFGFLGSNGAGKTTTIRLLMNLLRGKKGNISFFGTPLQKNPVKLRERIGYLPGDFDPYREMTGVNFLKYMAKYRNRSPVLREKLINKLKLSIQDISQKTKYLSHGTRQKLGLVLAFEFDPDLAILDEPTIGLDPLMQETFYEIIWDFQKRGKTIFLSSHILPEVEKVCHRVAIIRKGEIVALESIENLREKRPRRMTIELTKAIKENPITFTGVKLLNQTNSRFEYLIESDIPRLLIELGKLPIKDIIFPEPDLEDIFLDYYSDKN